MHPLAMQVRFTSSAKERKPKRTISVSSRGCHQTCNLSSFRLNFCADMNRSITQEYNEVKAYDAWRVAQSNPCFEIWLYYHFFDDTPNIEESSQHPSFKAFVHSCLPGGFDYQRDPAWLKSAIGNSLKNFRIQPNGNPQIFSTEQHHIGNDIYEFVGYEVQKLRNKLG